MAGIQLAAKLHSQPLGGAEAAPTGATCLKLLVPVTAVCARSPRALQVRGEADVHVMCNVGCTTLGQLH